MSVPSKPWFERWPDLLDWELNRFLDRGLTANVDERARTEGRLEVVSSIGFRGEEREIRVRYPSEYPELPPTVFGPSGMLERHQNPFNDALCLLADTLDGWNAESWGAADLIADQLSALLRDTEAGNEVLRAAEEPIPEPFTGHYPYPVGPVVIMDEQLATPPGDSGVFKLRAFHLEGARFVVEAVDGMEASPALLDVFSGEEVIEGKWIRIDGQPPGPNAADVVLWIRRHAAELLPPPVPPRLVGSARLRAASSPAAALVFREEGPQVGEYHDAWLFVFQPFGAQPFLMHHQTISREQRDVRVPELKALPTKSVLVVGLGTLGGEIAVKLAQAGVGRLDIIDYDRFEVNNAVRHVLGTDYAGIAKTVAIEAAARRMNPFCEVGAHHLTIGAPTWAGQSSLEVISKLVANSDLVVEATGSHQLQVLLGRVTSEYKKPMVTTWLTPGFVGAHIVRFIPSVTCCYHCFLTDLRSPNGARLRAEAGQDVPIVAQGCSHPTVSGAGVDASEASIVTTRLAIQTLLRGEPDGYPDATWDHAVLNFRRDPAGEPARFAVERCLPSIDCGVCVGVGSEEALSVTS